MRTHVFLRFHAERVVDRIGRAGCAGVVLIAASALLAGYATFGERPALQRLEESLRIKTDALASSRLSQTFATPVAPVEATGTSSSSDLALLLQRCAHQAAVPLSDLAIESTPVTPPAAATTRAVVRTTGRYAQLKRFQALVLDADPRIALLDLSLAKRGAEARQLDGRYTFVRFE